MQSNMIFQERSAIQNWTNFIWNEIGFTLQFPHGAYHQKFISPDQTSLSKGATRLRLLCEKSHKNCAYPKMRIESARYRFYAGLISSAFINYRARGSQAAAALRKRVNQSEVLFVRRQIIQNSAAVGASSSWMGRSHRLRHLKNLSQIATFGQLPVSLSWKSETVN